MRKEQRDARRRRRLRSAKCYVDLNHLAIVIVGDRATIEGPLKATGVAPITIIDIEGNPVPGGATSSSSN